MVHQPRQSSHASYEEDVFEIHFFKFALEKGTIISTDNDDDDDDDDVDDDDDGVEENSEDFCGFSISLVSSSSYFYQHYNTTFLTLSGKY